MTQPTTIHSSPWLPDVLCRFDALTEAAQLGQLPVGFGIHDGKFVECGDLNTEVWEVARKLTRIASGNWHNRTIGDLPLPDYERFMQCCLRLTELNRIFVATG